MMLMMVSLVFFTSWAPLNIFNLVVEMFSPFQPHSPTVNCAQSSNTMCGYQKRPHNVHSAEDPRLLKMLSDECLIYSAISIDLFSEIYVMAHGRARGKPTYPISILVSVCLVSNSTAFMVMEDSKANSVGKALDMLKLRYRMPTLIVCDKESSFQSL